MKINFRQIRRMMARNGYIEYSEPFKLNIVGIRSPNTKPNKFDDLICCYFKGVRGRWHFYAWKATTDPGTYWLDDKLAHPAGTAILKAGQYVDVYQIAKHRGSYDAICQRGGPVTVIRDPNRDGILDFTSPVEMTGNFGINIHRANSSGTTVNIGPHSAGCQVFSTKQDFVDLLGFARLHEARHGNKFTYTLFDFREVRKDLNMTILKGGLLVLAAGTIALAKYLSNQSKQEAK